MNDKNDPEKIPIPPGWETLIDDEELASLTAELKVEKPSSVRKKQLKRELAQKIAQQQQQYAQNQQPRQQLIASTVPLDVSNGDEPPRWCLVVMIEGGRDCVVPFADHNDAEQVRYEIEQQLSDTSYAPDGFITVGPGYKSIAVSVRSRSIAGMVVCPMYAIGSPPVNG